MRTSRRAGGLSLVLASLAACGDQGPIIETVDTDVPVVDAPTVTDRPRAADVQRIADVPLVAPPRDAGAPPVDVPRAVMDSGVVVVEEPTPDLTPDGGAPVVDVEPAAPTTGATMRVTATSLNLRSGVGTSHAILTVLSCGTRVTVLGGPTTGWWNIRSGAFTGWASGAYLVAEAGFDPAVCGGALTPRDGRRDPPRRLPAPRRCRRCSPWRARRWATRTTGATARGAPTAATAGRARAAARAAPTPAATAPTARASWRRSGRSRRPRR
ncbi:MAG: SH3 domain-containing protein [Deltaproteobacteria bacterium]|nr:SH3 domain-containing protein [Deltaproteobacteria bacterium]